MNNSNTSAQATKNELVVVYRIDDNEIMLTPKIVQDYIVGGNAQITLPEYKMFSEMCKVRKLNPFLKEAYLVKYSEKTPAQLIVGKEAILKRAVLNPQFDGREQGIIVANKQGHIIEKAGTFKTEDEKLLGGWARVYRKDWTHPTYITVTFEEVAQKKGDGSLNSNWAGKGATMVEKVALVRALRETFVEDLGGMIDENEAWDPDNIANGATPITVLDMDENVIEAKTAEIKPQNESAKSTSNDIPDMGF
jgi:phage recombination protein Bet